MTTPDLFTNTGLADLNAFISTDTLVAFDLDGTLVPIVDNPGDIRMSASVQNKLARLIKQATVAVITGRALKEARSHLGVTPGFVVGNHGAEGLPGHLAEELDYFETCIGWEKQLLAILPREDYSGIHIENKGATIAIHYRSAINREKARVLIMEAISTLRPQPRHVTGKCVENIVPETAPDKGVAMLELMRSCGLSKGFFVGDDATDEDVFKLDGPQLFTVRIGAGSVASQARYLLQGQQDIVRLLDVLSDAMYPAA